MKTTSFSITYPRNRTVTQLVVKSNVKEYLGDMNTSGDLYEELDEEIENLLDRASQRAQDNDRRTVQPRDL